MLLVKDDELQAFHCNIQIIQRSLLDAGGKISGPTQTCNDEIQQKSGKLMDILKFT